MNTSFQEMEQTWDGATWPGFPFVQLKAPTWNTGSMIANSLATGGAAPSQRMGCWMYNNAKKYPPGGSITGGFGFGGNRGANDSWNHANDDPVKDVKVSTGNAKVTSWDQYRWTVKINDNAQYLDIVEIISTTKSKSTCSDSFRVSEKDCVCGETKISCLSTQMAINQTQTLTATNTTSGCIYSWAITGGGGSLSSSTGESVVYTAPGNNVNCASNPTITLSSENGQCDSVVFAINKVTGAYPAADIKRCSNEFYCNTGNEFCARIGVHTINCDGSENAIPRTYCGGGSATNPACNTDPLNSVFCSTIGRTSCASTATSAGGGFSACTYINSKALGVPNDIRTASDKLAGCCPSQLR